MREVGEEDLGLRAFAGQADGVLDLLAGDRALEDAVREPEVEYVVTVPGEGGETEVFFSDLSEAYVRLNAEYTS